LNWRARNIRESIPEEASAAEIGTHALGQSLFHGPLATVCVEGDGNYFSD
jgi:hypothetical protein